MPHPEASLLDHIPIPAMLVEKGQVIYSNPAARELLGGHIVGQDARIALRMPEAVALLASEEGGHARVQGLSVPGSQWNLCCTPLETGARMITLEDLSVRVSVVKAHTDFVANASHELRTPLASILGYLESLENPKAAEDAPTRTRFLGIIRHEAKRMRALIEDLMSLSRIEAGKHDAPTEPVELIGLAASCVRDAEALGEVILTCTVDRAEVAGDRGQLAQAIRNLIENAFKYGKPGGPVTVHVETSASGRIILAVRDEGEGIAPDHLPRLTERFYRADTARSRAQGGTGLGLSIVKHIVERHRGRFDLASKLGEGTVATIILPALAG